MKKIAVRLFYLLIGMFLFALGIVLSINANIGYAPWEVFHVGLALATGMSIGIASIVVGVVLVVIVTVCGEKIGLGTIFSMILIGVLIDVNINLKLIPLAGNLITGIGMLLLGLLSVALGTYFYIKSAFGGGPRDNIMVVMGRKTKFPVGVCRSIVELSVTVIGWVLGGMVGVGTIISVVAIGLFIQIVFAVFKFDPAMVEHETLMQTFKSLKALK
jgi:uncharacterized membrane protein YczE